MYDVFPHLSALAPLRLYSPALWPNNPQRGWWTDCSSFQKRIAWPIWLSPTGWAVNYVLLAEPTFSLNKPTAEYLGSLNSLKVASVLELQSRRRLASGLKMKKQAFHQTFVSKRCMMSSRIYLLWHRFGSTALLYGPTTPNEAGGPIAAAFRRELPGQSGLALLAGQ